MGDRSRPAPSDDGNGCTLIKGSLSRCGSRWRRTPGMWSGPPAGAVVGCGRSPLAMARAPADGFPVRRGMANGGGELVAASGPYRRVRQRGRSWTMVTAGPTAAGRSGQGQAGGNRGACFAGLAGSPLPGRAVVGEGRIAGTTPSCAGERPIAVVKGGDGDSVVQGRSRRRRVCRGGHDCECRSASPAHERGREHGGGNGGKREKNKNKNKRQNV